MEKTVDYTQVLHTPHLLKKVLDFLPDDTVLDDFDSLVWVDREFQDEVTKERPRRIVEQLLTYGAAAIRAGRKYDERVLTSILGKQDYWKTSKDAMTLVARTFSGAKHNPNGPYQYKNLYPELPQNGPNSESKPAFRKVLQWWRWMCTNNPDIATKTDLLSFFLFVGENWKRQNQPQNDFDKDNIDNLSINGDMLTIKTEVFSEGSSYCVSATKLFSFYDFEYTLSCSPYRVQFTTSCPADGMKIVDVVEDFMERGVFEDRVMDIFQIDSNDTALWAHACVDVLIAKANMKSIIFNKPRFLQFYHTSIVDKISRKSDQDEFDSGENQFMY